MTNAIPLLRFSHRQRVFLSVALSMVLAVSCISLLAVQQSRQLAEREIIALEEQLLQTKREELKNYMSIARTAFGNIYGRALPDDEDAKAQVKQLLSSMLYGQDGFFFVFDYDGTNHVSPRQTYLIDRNWRGLKDIDGIPITDRLIEIARTGGGYHTFSWSKPTTRETASTITYVIGLQDWRWAVGTGVFIDDVFTSVATARAEVEDRINRTFRQIGLATFAALMIVSALALLLNIRESRRTDVKLKQLTQRIFDTQEEERGRVARELHDSISQILVGVRYSLELAKRRLAKGDPDAGENLSAGIQSLAGAIQEVRRISRDLRPGMLDDLGLGPALRTLTDEFSARTKINIKFQSVVFRNRLDDDAKIALYRVAQEALTNIERHAQAQNVSLSLRGTRRGALMEITDDGIGLPDRPTNGMGLRNMSERMEHLNGTLKATSTPSGTLIQATVPLTHMLPPQTPQKDT